MVTLTLVGIIGKLGKGMNRSSVFSSAVTVIWHDTSFRSSNSPKDSPPIRVRVRHDTSFRSSNSPKDSPRLNFRVKVRVRVKVKVRVRFRFRFRFRVKFRHLDGSS